MRTPLRRAAFGAMAAGVIAGGAAVGLPGSAPSTHAEALLPTTISPTRPVRVVSTTVDDEGRPSVTVRTATDRPAAARLLRQGRSAANAVGVEVDAPMSALAVPAGTDTYRGKQWNLDRIGAADAWETATGNGVTVAVLDTGVDAGHPDLAGQVLPGIDLVARTQGVSSDPHGHGTHVAGTIAALTGNGAGVAGVAPDAKILPVRVLDADGNGFMSTAAAGIVWATDNGADIISLSFGSATRTAAVSSALQYARDEGVLVVAAAGNSRLAGNPVTYPAADKDVLAVAATDAGSQVAGYSAQGTYVDVAAPGNDIVSTTTGGGYATMYGTSMAAAQVSAVAALVKSAEPTFGPDEIEAALEYAAVDRGARGKDRDFGWGIADAARAVEAAGLLAMEETPAPAPTPTPTRTVAKASVNIIGGGRFNVDYGRSTTATFTVNLKGRPWADQAVKVCTADPGPAFVCADTTTDGRGKVAVTRPATGPYQVMVAVDATDTSNAATSRIVSYGVRAKVTVTRPAPGSLIVRLDGARGQLVQVQQQDKKKGWVRVVAYQGDEVRVLTGLVRGQRYRAVVSEQAGVLGVTSPVVLA
ncbi:S8 family serine peptidase [Paractinoplanes brasiliensis]|uniref:Type VII secretion-associated serine protease mycosin n=1 Tax=Paractinoplanes brasiliensis TaxID=52695 RepID=A0A4V3C8F0_9ACTN|nr:S8 family serine peptidase [Actinoplanes brasiliensis]TDO41348.1 type VII secretion-associated serine protease mycosin [Actinoplanes brasiliensis]GID27370.1 hypothetical protein Abr02nite_23530 [Actinoplanes brasiliensis]